MKVTLPTRLSRPRNPLVAASRVRGGAGSHRPGTRSIRQRGRRALTRELEALARSP